MTSIQSSTDTATLKPTDAPAPALTFPDGRPVPTYLSVVEVAELFGLSSQRVYNAIKQDELYARKFTARRFKIMLSDALAWFNADRTGEK